MRNPLTKALIGVLMGLTACDSPELTLTGPMSTTSESSPPASARAPVSSDVKYTASDFAAWFARASDLIPSGGTRS